MAGHHHVAGGGFGRPARVDAVEYDGYPDAEPLLSLEEETWRQVTLGAGSAAPITREVVRITLPRFPNGIRDVIRSESVASGMCFSRVPLFGQKGGSVGESKAHEDVISCHVFLLPASLGRGLVSVLGYEPTAE